MELMTAVGNDRAQSLYRSRQWNEVTGYITFEKTLTKPEGGQDRVV